MNTYSSTADVMIEKAAQKYAEEWKTMDYADQALAIMHTTGPAHMSADGYEANSTMIESGEYVAALYESYAADHEAVDTWSTTDTPNAHQAAHAYAITAENLAERIWQEDVEELQGW